MALYLDQIDLKIVAIKSCLVYIASHHRHVSPPNRVFLKELSKAKGVREWVKHLFKGVEAIRCHWATACVNPPAQF